MGTRVWLKLNVYAPRYLLPSVFLTQAALAMLIVEPLGSAMMARQRRWLPIVVASLLLLGVTWGYGFPSLRRVRADVDRLSVLTPDVLASGCTHIAGDYWTVWPAIFHVNLALYERSDPRTIWGVTFGGQPTSTIWRTSPQEEHCACIPVNDPFGDNWLISFGLSRFRDVQRRAVNDRASCAARQVPSRGQAESVKVATSLVSMQPCSENRLPRSRRTPAVRGPKRGGPTATDRARSRFRRRAVLAAAPSSAPPRAALGSVEVFQDCGPVRWSVPHNAPSRDQFAKPDRREQARPDA